MNGPGIPESQRLSPDSSSADLLRECGDKLTDKELWQKFQDKFHRLIGLYAWRAVRLHHGKPDADLICDLVQDVYLRLLQNGGRVLRTFRGGTDFSVRALLGRTAMSVVIDYYRSRKAGKRQVAEIISIDQVRRGQFESATEDIDVAALLSWIDVERMMDSDSDRRNAARNVLIFKLHHMDGFTAEEIAEFPAFNLSVGAVETVLRNLRNHLRRRLER